MAQFHIYHSTGKDRFQEVENQPRKYAGFVEADSLEQAFRKAQNEDSEWSSYHQARSTSVGDIIQGEGKFYMVCGIGFKELV
jgi:hypothetical protein